MMKVNSCLLLLLAIVASFSTSPAMAIAPFKKAFDASYVKDSGDEAFQTSFRKTGCYTCHVHKEKKDVVNAYGWALSELLEGNAKDRIKAARENGKDAKKAEEEKLVKELEVAMKKVEAMKASPGKTYGEMFKAHELPNGDGAKSVRKE
jgi:Skp family chaperone for outer membrane proteins